MSYRTLCVAVLSTMLLAIGLTVPSNAETGFVGGALAVRGTGSAYTGVSHPWEGAAGEATFVSLAVADGATASYGIQVWNTGTVQAQFRIQLEDAGGTARKTELLAGSLIVSKLAGGPEGYYTAPLDPGKMQAFTLKVTVPAGTPHSTLRTTIHLRATNGSLFDDAWVYTEVKAPLVGPHAVDVFARQGSQPFVGGTDTEEAQVASAPPVKVGGSAVFNVKLQNNRPQSGYLAATLPADTTCADIVVKDGSVDVTASIVGGYYVTPPVKSGGIRNLTVTFTRKAAAGCRRWTGGGMVITDLGSSPNPPSYSVGLLVPYAYA